MKKSVLFLILISFLFSCKDEGHDKGMVGAVSNVTSTSFIGSVILEWVNPSDENLYYTLVSYKSIDGKLINKKVDRYSLNSDGMAETIIGGFSDTNEYQFTLTSFNYTGGASSPVTVSGRPRSTEEAKDYVIGTVNIVPSNSGALVSWVNETGIAVNLVATYLNQKGIEQEVTVHAGSTGKRTLTGFVKTTDIRIVAINVEDGAKSEEKVFTITPEIDPDDIVYDNVDYVTFGSGANQLSFTQDNEDNPYEYTFITSGGDPYLNCNGLKQPVVGTKLVFRYKSTAVFDLELFWCNAGGGAAGGRSTVVNVPENNKEEWKTFTYDYATAMAQHSWAGNTGDYARFDWGNKSGVTIYIRNIHFK